MRWLTRSISPRQWRLALGIIAALAFVVVAYGATRTHAASKAWPMIERQLIALSAHAGLAVQAVDVEGRVHASAAAILKALDVRRDSPILAVDAQAARERLLDVPWVKTASIYRRLPDTLFIRLTEQKPLAFWQHDNRLTLIDHDGHPIATRRLDAFSHLLVLVGKDVPAHATAFLDMLASEPKLARQVTAAVLVGDRRWNVTFTGGVTVALPEEHAVAAWHRLARIEAAHRILERQVVLVDLRLPGRVYLKLPPDLFQSLMPKSAHRRKGA
ncbi:MAG: cell division protein FtsQ/DivIB [Stellaceae bacterium]